MKGFNRDKAIAILERHDGRWDYEDLTDAQLFERLVDDVRCRAENRMMNRCKSTNCIECWARMLGA